MIAMVFFMAPHYLSFFQGIAGAAPLEHSASGLSSCRKYRDTDRPLSMENMSGAINHSKPSFSLAGSLAAGIRHPNTLVTFHENH